MNFKQFVDEKRSLYEAFAETIRTIIDVVLSGEPSAARPQQIQIRAKSPMSLARKLKERGLERSRSIEKEIKDLAGVRLIFYTNSDERSFLNSRIINENFHIDYDASKVHHPVGTPADVNEQYRGLHYVLALKEDRLKLPEYSRFAGLRCEIQIQTILNHAWSETAHDILYHRPDGATGFGTKQYDRIHKRMSGIMEKHLVPAGHEFEKVHHDFQWLMAGKALFDQGIVSVIQGATDNNERHELIERIRNDVLPQCDDVNAIAKDLGNALVEAIEQARQTETKPIEVGPGFGSFPGKSEVDVAEAALRIITDLRYIDVLATFQTILELFRGAKSDAERKHILEAAKKLAEYHFGVLRKVGPVVQSALVEEIVKMGWAASVEYRPVVQCVCENVLKSEVRGVSSETYDTVSIHTGAIAGTDLLGETRRKALDILLALCSSSRDLNEKRLCYDALSAAMDLPNIARYEEPLWLLVIRDTKKILEFFTKEGAVPPYNILQDLENHCVRIFENAAGVRNIEPKKAQIIAAYDEVLPLIERFRKTINANANYAIFKTLVGFRPVFEDDLSKEDHNWRRRDAIREARMVGYLNEIDQTTADDWLSLLIDISKERDAAQHLSAFLERVGTNKPEIALKWLLQPSLPVYMRTALLLGALKSRERDAAIAMTREWIAGGIYLASPARVIHFSKDTLDELLPLLAEKALAIADLDALVELVPSFIKRAATLNPSLTDTFLLPAVHMLAESKRWYWLTQVLPDQDEQQFLGGLTADQAGRLLKDFVAIPRIDYHEEVFLKPIAKSRPLAVLNMFKERTEYKEEAEPSYGAIPFSLHELPDALAASPNLIIGCVRTWYAADSMLFEYKGGRLLALVFPSFSEVFGKALQALVKRDLSAIDFVLSVLQNYEGEPALHETFKVIIKLIPENDERLIDIERALDATGVVRGEFGFVEAYQQKRRLVEPWLTDKRPRVRKFAERHIRSLDRATAAEQRRAEANLELRKHDFDPDGG